MATLYRRYTELDSVPIVTAPIVHRLAEASLLMLARQGVHEDGGPVPGDSVWLLTGCTRHGAELSIRCSGPDLPERVPDETIRPADVGKSIPWVGKWRLVVRAPLAVLDLYWRPAEPLRILQFSRGDWEQDLVEETLSTR